MVDLSKSLPESMVRAEVVEGLRRHILRLQSDLASNKRAKTAAAPANDAVAGSSAPSAAAVKATEKKQRAQVKKLFDSLKKSVGAEKWQGRDKVMKVEDVLEKSEFAEIFMKPSVGGTLLQPLPNNKPTSSVTIKTFSPAELAALFGAEWKPEALKGYEWTVGGIHQGKSQKVGQVAVDVTSLEVQYAASSMKLTMKFGCGAEVRYAGMRGFGWVRAW